jgi:hypothetical protein
MRREAPNAERRMLPDNEREHKDDWERGDPLQFFNRRYRGLARARSDL